MGSAGIFIVGLIVVAALAGAGFYWYWQKGTSDTAGLFAPRGRRLAFVERTSLDGGRKLLLVRRDDVEHLIMVGGPIDLVIESGIGANAKPSSVRGTEAKSGADAEPDARPRQQPSFFPNLDEGDRGAFRPHLPDIKAAE